MHDAAWLSVPPTRSLPRFAAARPAGTTHSPKIRLTLGLVLAALLVTSNLAPAQAADSRLPLSVSATFQPGENGRGVLTVTMDIHRIWHIYSITQPQGGPLPTTISVAAPPGVKIGPFTAQTKPEVHFDNIFEMNVEVHHAKAVWTAPVTFTDTQAAKLTGAVTAQACKVGACLPPRQYPFAVEISAK